MDEAILESIEFGAVLNELQDDIDEFLFFNGLVVPDDGLVGLGLAPF